MIKALNIASQGLQQAERRATDLASEILNSTSKAVSFSVDDPETATPASPASSAPVNGPSGAGYSDILQQMVDLKAEENAFRANATVFKRLDETYDDALGSLFDEDS